MGELDLRRLSELQQLLGAELPEILHTLISELAEATNRIEASIRAADLPAAAMAAHAARNSALMLDAEPLLDALRDVEGAAHDGDLGRAEIGLERLDVSWPPLRDQLERAAARWGG